MGAMRRPTTNDTPTPQLAQTRRLDTNEPNRTIVPQDGIYAGNRPQGQSHRDPSKQSLDRYIKIIYISAMTSVNPSFLTDLTTGRDFLAPAVECAVMSLNLAIGARVLDAGTGGGGALPPLVRAVGTTGSVLAVDRNPTIVALASDYVDKMGIVDRVTVQLGDIIEVLTDAATAPEKAFDVIWAADVVYPVYFEEPAEVVRRMVQALRPGGVVALFYPKNYYSTVLTGHPRLERGLCTASEISFGSPVDGPHHRERHLAWLLAADLDDVSLRMFPRVCFPVDADPTARPYLELTVWPSLLGSASAHGAEAGLSTEELDEIQRLLTPGDPHYILDEPGYYLACPTILVTGRRPDESL